EPQTEAHRVREGYNMIIAKAPNLAYGGTLYQDQTRPAEVTLSAEVPIEGRLLTPNGAPAKDVRVRLRTVAQFKRIEPLDGFGLLSPVLYHGKSTPLPHFNDQAVTDADGRFTFHGLPRGGMAELEVMSDEYAQDSLRIASKE